MFVRFFSRFLRVKGLKKWGWVWVWCGLRSLVWTVKSDGLKGQARPVHMSTSNLSHALTLVLSNHLESVTKQKHQHLSRFTHQSPTSYWLHHVCMYFQYSVFFNKFFGLFYIELMVSGNLSFYILTDMRLCFYGILCKLIISTSPNRGPYYVERMWNMYILVILIDW